MFSDVWFADKKSVQFFSYLNIKNIKEKIYDTE